MASTSNANGSAMGDTNTGNLLFIRVANRSTLGLSHVMNSESTTDWCRVYGIVNTMILLCILFQTRALLRLERTMNLLCH